MEKEMSKNPDNVLNIVRSDKAPVVLFIPETGIYPYLRSLAVLGNAVKKRKGNVLITHCTGQMERCPMMDMYRLPYDETAKREKAKLCKICTKRFNAAKKYYNFDSIEMANFLDKEISAEADRLVSESGSDRESIYYKGFPVGKCAQFDFTLATKYLYNSNLPEEYQKIYDAYIKNMILAMEMTEKICQHYNPSVLLMYGEYGEEQGARYVAIKNKITSMAVGHPVHYDVDCSRFSIWKYTNEAYFYPHCQRWSEVKNIPISKKYIEECWKDAIFRFFSGGSHVFSSRKEGDPESIFKKLKLDPNKKTIIVYTSSYDERYVKNIVMNVWKEGPNIADAFTDQTDWLKMLRAYVTSRDDVQIVVRIHPREGLRQFGFNSQHLNRLKTEFSEDIPDFSIVWPDDPISSYDLLELADLCLVPWTLMGQEAARLGIPVLSCTGNMFYPNDDFIQVATSPEEYKRKLDEMINMKYKWNHLQKSMRFYHWRIFIPSLDLGESVPKSFEDDSLWPEVSESDACIIDDVLRSKEDIIQYNITKWKKGLPSDAISRETDAIRRGIRIFIDSIFYPPQAPQKPSVAFLILRRFWKIIIGKNIKIIQKQKPFVDYKMKYTEEVSRLNDFILETRNNPNLRILISDGRSRAMLVNKGNVLHRMSPMVIRLAKLHQDNGK